jgi:23S rRNA pseudouridine1911/1915/1917 synthase
LLSEESEGLADESGSELRSTQIGAGQHAARLDKALSDLVPEFSRSYLQQLLVQGLVSLNGKPVTKSATRVKVGDQVVLEMRPTLQSQAFRPEPMHIEVVHEDAHLLVVNKPAGLVVHPAPGNWSGTLLNGLLARDDKALTVPRAGIVHRLDKDTSGLMVVARDRATMDALVALIAERKVQRQYLAMAHGGCSHRPRSTQPPAHGGGGLGTPCWQVGTDRYPLPGWYGRRLLGAMHPAHGAHPPDPGAHGISEAPAGGG